MPLLIDFIRIRRPTFCTTAHACSKSPLFLFTSGESTGFFFPASADLLAFVTRLASILRIGRLCNNIWGIRVSVRVSVNYFKRDSFSTLDLALRVGLLLPVLV